MRRCGDPGRGLSVAERLEIRQRVATGETFVAVAAAVGCSTKWIQRQFIGTGGLAPQAQARSPLGVSLGEREEISRGLRAGDSRRVIARRLGRAPSMVSRYVAPNGGAVQVPRLAG
ncbi:MAG TPA: helix-turn-helix domain-containing protein [Gemmatimonadales bacterium]|nr:helix-turn-helix domain-containing protein [Gemmatimonadales bacterium]